MILFYYEAIVGIENLHMHAPRYMHLYIYAPRYIYAYGYRRMITTATAAVLYAYRVLLGVAALGTNGPVYYLPQPNNE
jgi:hypothetical protein